MDVFDAYLRFNVLLLAAFGLWRVLRVLADRYGLEPSPAGRLRLSRLYFLACLLAVPLYAALAPRLPPAWEPSAIFEMQVVFEQGLQQELPWREAGLSFLEGLALLWLAGLLASAVVLFKRWRRLDGVAQRCATWKRQAGVILLISPEDAGPFSTCALGRPTVVLPQRLLAEPKRLRLVLAHELQHLRQGDLAWLVGLEVLRLLCFWNPAASAWLREFDTLQELACDAALVRKRPADKGRYGRCLLEEALLAHPLRVPAVSGMAALGSRSGTGNSQLKRRIVMLSKTVSPRASRLRVWGQGMVLGAGLLGGSLLVLAQQEDASILSQAPRVTQDYLPIVTIAPRYPVSALQDKVEGWVLTQFTVGTEGQVLDPRVVDSCFDGPGIREATPEGCVFGYDEEFHASALASISRFKFNPRLEDGQAVETEGVQYLYRFNLE